MTSAAELIESVVNEHIEGEILKITKKYGGQLNRGPQTMRAFGGSGRIIMANFPTVQKAQAFAINSKLLNITANVVYPDILTKL